MKQYAVKRRPLQLTEIPQKQVWPSVSNLAYMKHSRSHDLRIWPEYFERVLAGRKGYELRENDRRFREGDALILREWDPDTEEYTGRIVTAVVEVVIGEDFPGVEEGFVLLEIRPVCAIY